MGAPLGCVRAGQKEEGWWCRVQPGSAVMGWALFHILCKTHQDFSRKHPKGFLKFENWTYISKEHMEHFLHWFGVAFLMRPSMQPPLCEQKQVESGTVVRAPCRLSCSHTLCVPERTTSLSQHTPAHRKQAKKSTGMGRGESSCGTPVKFPCC